ncbi:hypothetical protein [Neorhizobium sp. SOG26]|uniref:hypothetical protein n=1 Tax=Neorhizobium sp. SOG26 TaxID=2060726 RepID=UPI00123783D9|nr:hypothetical protein [Neorhizobium sp. SOG26]
MVLTWTWCSVSLRASDTHVTEKVTLLLQLAMTFLLALPYRHNGLHPGGQRIPAALAVDLHHRLADHRIINPAAFKIAFCDRPTASV